MAFQVTPVQIPLTGDERAARNEAYAARISEHLSPDTKIRVLDLGCGNGLTPSKLNLPAEWHFVGADVNHEAVARAARQFPGRWFVVADAEKLPFADGTFDRVVVNVALPYMRIPVALAEIRRVLIADGKLWASLHDFRFTLGEIRKAFPRLIPTLFRFRVFLNGIVFHMTGRSLGESFQTKRGVALALRRESFSSPRFSHDEKRWIVEASSRCPGSSSRAA